MIRHTKRAVRAQIHLAMLVLVLPRQKASEVARFHHFRQEFDYNWISASVEYDICMGKSREKSESKRKWNEGKTVANCYK